MGENKKIKPDDIGYYCSWHRECIHITDLSFICPVIQFARDYEAGVGKYRKLAIGVPESEEEKKAKKEPEKIK